MGMYTKIKGEIDYSSSDFPNIIERVLEMIQSIGWDSVARYLPENSVAEGTQQYEEFEYPKKWYIENNELFWGDEPYKLGNLRFLQLPLPHPEEWDWEE
jgi:hypothetical protein